MTEYCMEIVEWTENHENELVVKSLPALSLGQAERPERGASRNLNHNKYYTRIIKTVTQPTGTSQPQGGE